MKEMITIIVLMTFFMLALPTTHKIESDGKISAMHNAPR